MVSSKRPRPLPEEALEDFAHAAGKLLEVTIDPAWMSGVRSNLKTALTMANFVAGFSLPDGTEPAPRYDLEQP